MLQLAAYPCILYPDHKNWFTKATFLGIEVYNFARGSTRLCPLPPAAFVGNRKPEQIFARGHCSYFVTGTLSPDFMVGVGNRVCTCTCFNTARTLPWLILLAGLKRKTSLLRTSQVTYLFINVSTASYLQNPELFVLLIRHVNIL